MATILFVALGVCTLIPYIFLRSKKRLLPGIILKVVTSVFFLLTTASALLAASPSQFEHYKYLFAGVFIGQVFGLMGDFWLDMKDMYLQHKETYMFAGFISFSVGHLFFIAGLLSTYGTHWKNLLLALGVAVIAGGVVPLTQKPLKVRYGKFMLISVVYVALFGFAISTALSSALRAPGGSREHPQIQALVMAIGLAVFLLSDLVLSGTFFGKGKERPIDYALNYILYYGGQFTIAVSMALLNG